MRHHSASALKIHKVVRWFVIKRCGLLLFLYSSSPSSGIGEVYSIYGCEMDKPVKNMALVIDYQNVHISAHEIFAPTSPIEDSLICPVNFARQLQKVKNTDSLEKMGCSFSITRVELYRGLPSAHANPQANARNLKQKEQWMKSAKLHDLSLEVVYRPLKYKYLPYPERGIDLSVSPQEKGVDVLCALALVRLASSRNFDGVILASRDTDLIPAIEQAHEYCQVEAVKWFNNDLPYTRGSLRPEGFRLWTTNMRAEDYRASLDLHDYSLK